jgi:hypothetical protein
MYVFKCAPQTLDDSTDLLYTYDMTANKYCTIRTNNRVEKPDSSKVFFFGQIFRLNVTYSLTYCTLHVSH